jgi:hypothetical protein
MIYGEDFRERAKVALEAAQAADAGKEAVAWIRKTDITEWTDTEPETDGWTALFDNPPVAAINAELVEALEAITDQLERIGDTRRHKDGQYIEQARAALSRAKEQK